MAAISISVEEYDAMQSSLRKTSEEIAILDNKINAYKQICSEYQDIIDELVNSGLIERVFKWDKLVESLNFEHIEKLKESVK